MTHCMTSDRTCATKNQSWVSLPSSCKTRRVERKRRERNRRRLVHNAPSKERNPQTCPLPSLSICSSS